MFVTDLYSCQSSTVEPITLSSISIEVSDEIRYFSFESFKDSASTANQDQNFCSKTYQISITTNANGVDITGVWVDASNNQLIFASKRINQIGNYTVTLTAFITQYPNRNASSSFTLVVNDPCTKNYLRSSSENLKILPRMPKVNYSIKSPPIKIDYQSIIELSQNSN